MTGRDDTSEHWKRADALFDAALDLPPGERESFLDRECAGDPELRRAVDELLRFAGEGGGLPGDEHLASLLVDPGGAPEADLTGTTLGPFRLGPEIGRGGMAVVHLAERIDGAFEQRVAIKVLRRGIDTDDALARFAQERQILARATHPRIARLIDGGSTADGRPYFVMEHVEGQPIDRWCDERRLTGATCSVRPPRPWPTRIAISSSLAGTRRFWSGDR